MCDSRVQGVSIARLCWLLSLWLVALACAAQPVTAEYNDVRFKRIGVEEGLSQATVRVLFQGPEGYVWMGTQDGLNRYDGDQFRIYYNDPDRDDSLPDNHIMALEGARRGGFWVGTQAGGLARYDPAHDTFERYPFGSAQTAATEATVRALHETEDGRLWVASGASTLQWLAPEAKALQSVPPDVARQVGTINTITTFNQAVLLGSNTGVWWLATDGQSVRRFFKTAEPVAINAIEVTPDGQGLWVGTVSNGLWHLDAHGQRLGQFDTRHGLSDGQVLSLKFDDLGRLWVGTLYGLSRLDEPDALTQSRIRAWRYGRGPSGTVPASRINSLLLDRDGLIWAGSWRNGVSLHVPQSEAFADISLQSDNLTSGTSVYGLDVDEEGSIWLALPENLGAIHYNLKTNQTHQYMHDPNDPTSLPDWAAAAVLVDRHERVWVATYNGLALKQGEGFRTFRHDADDPDSLPSNALHALYEDREGTLWITTRDGLVASRCDGCEGFRRYQLGDGSQRGETVFEDSRGRLWAGASGIGLFQFNRSRQAFEPVDTRTGEADGLSHSSATFIMEDSHQRLWIGTQGGGVNLMQFDQNAHAFFKTYSVREGLAAAAVGGIVEDRRGQLWISTTTGVSRLNPETGHIVNYGPAAGAQVMGYFVGAAERMPDGRIIFGGMQGVTLIDPEKIEALPSPRNVALTELTVLRPKLGGSGSYSPELVPGAGYQGRKLRFSSDVDDLSFGLSALSFASPERVIYAYRMDRASNDWVEVDANHRRVSFNNLEPGEYVFQAKARMPDGPWSAIGSLPIELEPAWWQTAWAKIGYISLSLLILGVVGWEIRSRANERERSQAAIAQSEQNLKLALWGSGDELWDWDLDQRTMRRQNPLDAVGAERDERVESVEHLLDSLHPDDRTVLVDSLTTQLRGPGELVEGSYRIRTSSGDWRWRLSRGRVVARDEDGAPLRVVGTSSDITRIKDNELALARINAELESRVSQRTQALHDSNASLQNTIDTLQQTRQQLVDSEKMAALGGLVAGVAHEINTPIGVSVTAASFLQEQAEKLALPEADPDTETKLEPLARFREVAVNSSALILRNLRRADRLIKSFKQVAVDQSSEASRRIDLRSYLEEVLTSLQPSLRKHKVELDCPHDINFETYPGAISQVISNLVMNSIAHAFKPDKPGRIQISAQVADDCLRMVYRDDGIGMDEATRKRIFEPFFTTKRGTGGSGLGMHITWNLVTQALGGSIQCESAPGEGVCFTLTIPMAIKAPIKVG